MALFNLTPKEVDLSRAAKNMMDNHAFKKAFKDTEEFYRRAWEETSLSQKEEREQIYMLTKLLLMVKRHLVGRVDQGEAYFKQLNMEKELKREVK